MIVLSAMRQNVMTSDDCCKNTFPLSLFFFFFFLCLCCKLFSLLRLFILFFLLITLFANVKARTVNEENSSLFVFSFRFDLIELIFNDSILFLLDERVVKRELGSLFLFVIGCFKSERTRAPLKQLTKSILNNIILLLY